MAYALAFCPRALLALTLRVRSAQARWENFQARTALLEVLHGRHHEGGEADCGEGAAAEPGEAADEGGAALPARGRSPPCTGGWGWTGIDTWGGRDEAAPPRAPSPPPPARWRLGQQQQEQQPPPQEQEQPQRRASHAPSREGSRPSSRAVEREADAE